MADMRLWGKDVVVELLALYKSFPCLWKIKSEGYTNKNLKEDAYRTLVGFCKEKGFCDANRDFVVKKIQSLRGSFRKELRKVKDSQRSGKGADEVYTSSLWYYNHLLFTKDQEQPTGSFSNDDVPEHENSNIDEADQIDQGGMDDQDVTGGLREVGTNMGQGQKPVSRVIFNLFTYNHIFTSTYLQYFLIINY